MRARGAYVKWKPIYNEFGFTKGSMESDKSEDSRSWTIGQNPILFPYLLAFGPQEGDARIRRLYQIGVPIDDTHTWHLQYCCYVFPKGVDVPKQDAIPYRELPITDERGELIMDYVLAQDMAAWYQQGEIADRTRGEPGLQRPADHRVPADAAEADRDRARRRRADERVSRPDEDRKPRAAHSGQRERRRGTHAQHRARPLDSLSRRLPQAARRTAGSISTRTSTGSVPTGS